MGLRHHIMTDPVSELELRELVAVSPKTTVRQTAHKMREKHLGCAIIVDDAGKPVGKFTERKLMKMLMADPDGLDKPVEKFMYPSADPIRRDEPIAAMIAKMQKGGLRFICVTDEEGRAVALAGQKGLMEYMADHFPRQVKVQRMKSKLYMDEREGA